MAGLTHDRALADIVTNALLADAGLPTLGASKAALARASRGGRTGEANVLRRRLAVVVAFGRVVGALLDVDRIDRDDADRLRAAIDRTTRLAETGALADAEALGAAR